MIFIANQYTLAPGSASHLVILSGCVAAMIAAAVLGHRWKRSNPSAERRLRITWAVLTIVAQTISTVWWLLPAQFRLDMSLPIHPCDIAILMVPLAMLTTWRWPRVLLYFLGIGLCTQAVIQPMLVETMYNPLFWVFWLTHTLLIGGAVYIVAVSGYRPTLRDVAFALIITAIYIAAVTPLNMAFHLDYGYVGPADGPAADVGPWPKRIFMLYSMVVAVFILLWLPWSIWRAVQRKRVSAAVE